jgi:all-trans-8'-apo-beta-carotenal 15,15'-oxygenase
MAQALGAHSNSAGILSDWASAFHNVTTEFDGIILQPRRGNIPRGLNGTLYRNGPGRLERDGLSIHHPFDGDGMVTAISFKNGSIELRNRFVRTDGWLEEEKAGSYLYRGLFGSQKHRGFLANFLDFRVKNVANTNVVLLGDNLLALWEAGSPYALDPVSLETRGLTLLDGALKPGERLSAHPRFDPGHHGEARMVAFAVTPGPLSKLHLMEFSNQAPMKGRLITDRTECLRGFKFLHDFAITKNWAIFFLNPIRLNPLPFIFGQKGAAQCLRPIADRHGKFLLIPRDCGAYAGEPTILIDGPAEFIYHHLNAYEDTISGEVIIDSIYYNCFPDIGAEPNFRNIDLASIPEGRLRRCRIDPKSSVLDVDWIDERCCEFAMVNPFYQGRAASFAWMAVAEAKVGSGFLQAIQKLNLQTKERTIWSISPRGFVSEPVMVPMPASDEATRTEDHGWVLVLIWNAERRATDLVILNAADMSEQALIELPLAIPHGLHGSWVDAPV